MSTKSNRKIIYVRGLAHTLHAAVLLRDYLNDAIEAEEKRLAEEEAERNKIKVGDTVCLKGYCEAGFSANAPGPRGEVLVVWENDPNVISVQWPWTRRGYSGNITDTDAVEKVME